MTHILLVEDSPDIGGAIQQYLEACHRKVTWVVNVQEAKKSLEKGFFDVAVLDWMLPDGSGEQLCAWVKKEYPMPVILATAKSQIEDKLEGFHAGADDYLAKPFDLRELEARIRILIKGKTTSSEIVHIGELSFDLTTMQIARHDQQIHATAHQWIALKLLLENPGEVVSRSAFMEYIWGTDGSRDTENKLDVLIAGLRKKLGKGVIQTVKGYGYRAGVG